MTKDERYNRSEKGRARSRAYDARHGHGRKAQTNARRVFGASGYLGLAPTLESAGQLNSMGREFRDRQKQSRA